MFEQPTRYPCPTCHGRGNSMAKCQLCDGSGTHSGGSAPEPCDGCGGTGVAQTSSSQLCPTCQGRGSLLPPPP